MKVMLSMLGVDVRLAVGVIAVQPVMKMMRRIISRDDER